MTDKERLEEIETKYSTLTVSSERDGIEYTEVDVKDLVFLIQNGFKQAERVEELERKIERYREALEAIAYFDDKEEGEVATRIDVKYIAHKALEGESDA